MISARRASRWAVADPSFWLRARQSRSLAAASSGRARWRGGREAGAAGGGAGGAGAGLRRASFELMDGRMDGWTDPGRMDRLMDGRMDGCID
eukprot:2630920-Prymnesium_polylepis.2